MRGLRTLKRASTVVTSSRVRTKRDRSHLALVLALTCAVVLVLNLTIGTADERFAWHLGEQRWEGNKGQTNTSYAFQISNWNGLGVSQESKCSKDADTGKELKAGVCEGNYYAGTGEITSALEIRGVGQHYAEGNGEGKEDMPIGSDPYGGVC